MTAFSVIFSILLKFYEHSTHKAKKSYEYEMNQQGQCDESDEMFHIHDKWQLHNIYVSVELWLYNFLPNNIILWKGC